MVASHYTRLSADHKKKVQYKQWLYVTRSKHSKTLACGSFDVGRSVKQAVWTMLADDY